MHHRQRAKEVHMKSLLCWVAILGLTLSVSADDPKPNTAAKTDKAEVKIYDE